MIKRSTGNSDKPAWNLKSLFSSATSPAYQRAAHFSNIMDKFHHREINNRIIQRVKSKTSKGIEKSVFQVRNLFLDNRTVKEIFKIFFFYYSSSVPARSSKTPGLSLAEAGCARRSQIRNAAPGYLQSWMCRGTSVLQIMCNRLTTPSS